MLTLVAVAIGIAAGLANVVLAAVAFVQFRRSAAEPADANRPSRLVIVRDGWRVNRRRRRSWAAGERVLRRSVPFYRIGGVAQALISLWVGATGNRSGLASLNGFSTGGVIGLLLVTHWLNRQPITHSWTRAAALARRCWKELMAVYPASAVLGWIAFLTRHFVVNR